MRIYVVLRVFDDEESEHELQQNEFVHTDLEQVQAYIKNDDWDSGRFHIEIWENGEQIIHCSKCEKEIPKKNHETYNLEPVCAKCKAYFEDWE